MSTSNLAESKISEFLWKPENVNRMIVMSERKLPALTGIVEELESHFKNDPDFPLENPHYRRGVGRIIRQILVNFGYDVAETGVYLRDFARSEFFSTSAVYEKKGTVTKKIVTTIEDVEASAESR
jgi:hypothetical protein